MDASDVIETLPVTRWTGPLEPELCARAVTALETGRVVSLNLPFALTDDETPFLDAGVLDASRKNISSIRAPANAAAPATRARNWPGSRPCCNATPPTPRP